MRALCMVAHPDDCVIFAYSLMHQLRKLEWTVAYLTYCDQDARYQEMRRFWNFRSVSTRCLGHRDDYRDIENNRCSFDTIQADIDIRETCAHYDIVLTHSPHGDYGHLHHQFVHDSVIKHHDHVITFAAPGTGTHQYKIDPALYSMGELPLHADVVRSFHPTQHQNSYHVPDHVCKSLAGRL